MGVGGLVGVAVGGLVGVTVGGVVGVAVGVGVGLGFLVGVGVAVGFLVGVAVGVGFLVRVGVEVGVLVGVGDGGVCRPTTTAPQGPAMGTATCLATNVPSFWRMSPSMQRKATPATMARRPAMYTNRPFVLTVGWVRAGPYRRGRCRGRSLCRRRLCRLGLYRRWRLCGNRGRDYRRRSWGSNYPPRR